ncbi:hypothetical protein QQF64_032234 [Cirrhinus molitorella]|uniref:Uncharacterized protein n=2 Tax=Cirrhinus molitorella TaxID=172907 RepID=A0AA88TQ01_9TELE|nr:hypothetical protein Q8A67_009949 [Cirrhinus molitorella]
MWKHLGNQPVMNISGPRTFLTDPTTVVSKLRQELKRAHRLSLPLQRTSQTASAAPVSPARQAPPLKSG